MGKCFGETAPNDSTDDVGGDQLSLGHAPESRGSLAGSTGRPK